MPLTHHDGTEQHRSQFQGRLCMSFQRDSSDAHRGLLMYWNTTDEWRSRKKGSPFATVPVHGGRNCGGRWRCPIWGSGQPRSSRSCLKLQKASVGDGPTMLVCVEMVALSMIRLRPAQSVRAALRSYYVDSIHTHRMDSLPTRPSMGSQASGSRGRAGGPWRVRRR